MFACKAKKEASKGLMDTFVKMIRGYEEPSKAAQHMKAALTSAGIQTLPYQSEPFQTFADIVTEHDTLKNMTEGPFQSERVKVAKALKTKSIQFQSMVADTHPSRMFLAECGACSDLIKNAVDFLTSAVKDVDEVREKSLAEVIEKTQAAYKKMSAWSNKVPDFQEDEAEFLKFAKANMAKGGALAQKLEKCIEECEKACTEWQCTATLDMDQVTAPAGEELRAMRAAVTIYTGLCLVRNPQIKTTQGAALRSGLEEVMKDFDSEELDGLCPATLREEADAIINIKKRGKDERTEEDSAPSKKKLKKGKK